MRDDFGIFILSHGRPDEVSRTIRALTKARYTGRWWIVLDTEDATAPAYAARWGPDRLLTFDKDEVAKTFDLADNGGPRGVIIYARNAAAALAAEQGLTYYMELDDDYNYFAHRMPRGDTLHYAFIYHLDDVLEALINFLDASGALTVAMAQGGDFIGGVTGLWQRGVTRKAMNTFIARVDRPIRFVGRINEDVNTYVWRGSQGDLFFTIADVSIEQPDTQSQAGGMTGTYVDGGTYAKSFYTVMHHPSSVKISTLGETSHRVHHHINWGHTVPKVISSSHRKMDARRPGVRILSGESSSAIEESP